MSLDSMDLAPLTNPHQESAQATQTPTKSHQATQDIQAEVNAALELPLLQSAKELLEIKQIKVRPKSIIS